MDLVPFTRLKQAENRDSGFQHAAVGNGRAKLRAAPEPRAAGDARSPAPAELRRRPHRSFARHAPKKPINTFNMGVVLLLPPHRDHFMFTNAASSSAPQMVLQYTHGMYMYKPDRWLMQAFGFNRHPWLGAFRDYFVVRRVGSEAVGGGGGPLRSRSST